jgi:hypothetical protein
MLGHWNNSLRVDMSLQCDTLSWFQANQFLFLLFNVQGLVKKKQTKYQFGLSWLGLEPTIKTSNYTTDVILNRKKCYKKNTWIFLNNMFLL